MTISVTQQHIDRGEALSCSRCPIALAISDCFLASCTVLHHSVCITDLGYYSLPNECNDFITAFDNNQPVSPFTFELELN